MNFNDVAIPILGATCVFLFVISLIPTKTPLAQTLEALEARVHASASENVNNPVERVLAEIVPQTRSATLSRKLMEAGWYHITPAQMLLRTFAGVCAGLALAMLIGRLLHLAPALVLAAQVLALLAAGYAPMSMLNRAIEARKFDVQRTLPDFLDMIASTVQAGLSVNAALSYAVDAAPGALGAEIKEALAEIRLGRGKTEALKSAAYRLNQQEFSTTIAAITQAERLGANIAKVLTELAEDTRAHRIMAVEEHASKLPVKMVFPMAFFLLPALFVIIIGTIAANYVAQRG